MIKIFRGVTVPMSTIFFIGLIHELKEMGCDVVVVSSDGPELQEVKDAGGRVITVEMERRFSPLKDLRSLWNMIKVFRRESPSIVHSMTPKAGLICMLAGWITRVPVRIHTFTGLVFPTSTGMKRKILMATDRLTCACATHIIPEGEGVKTDLINYRITNKPLKVLGYGNVKGVDLEYFNPDLPSVRAEAAKIKKPEVFTFVFVGRLARDKGINELVEAFVKLNTEYSEVRLFLIGPYEQDIDPIRPETLKRITHNHNIEAIGLQRDVRPWLAASDVFVLPSYREGFPNAVIEAGAMGLPSIVTDINGSREIIIEGKNGTIIPPRDVESLYKAMKRFIENKEMRNEMAVNCHQLIASRYEQGFVRQCLKDYYKEVMSV